MIHVPTQLAGARFTYFTKKKILHWQYRERYKQGMWNLSEAMLRF
jgi:hypothetical protein